LISSFNTSRFDHIINNDIKGVLGRQGDLKSNRNYLQAYPAIIGLWQNY